MCCIPFLSVTLEKEEGSIARKRPRLEQMSQKVQKDRCSPSQTHFYLCVGFLYNYHVKALNSQSGLSRVSFFLRLKLIPLT